MARRSATKTPANPTALASCAMLVDLTVRQWQGKKADKRATRELHAAHQANENAGEYRKRLLGECGPLKEVLDIGGEANRKHRELTLAWGDNGIRILASAGFFEYQQIMGDLKSRHNKAARKFLSEYTDLTIAARKDLGTLFLLEDYPSQAELATKFDFYWTITGLPLASDFRVNIKESEADRIREQMQANIEAKYAGAMHEAYTRVEQVIGHIVERLRAYQMTDKGLVGKFHDTLVTNAEELSAMLPKLNITGDPRMEEISERIRAELLAHSAQELRDSGKLRKETATTAESILKSMQQWAA